jgi:hypothetical protein
MVRIRELNYDDVRAGGWRDHCRGITGAIPRSTRQTDVTNASGANRSYDAVAG